MNKIDLLVFDVKGKFAHFRKYYTNSSSLSYSIPPRTTITGLMAGILGMERDSYYSEFSAENVKVAVRKLSKNRRIMSSLNYIKATNINDVIRAKEHTQIPFELLTSEDNVKYRIYINIKNKKTMKELEERIREKKYYYSPYLGAAPFNCSLEFIGRLDGEVVKENEFADINSVVNSRLIEEGCIDLTHSNLYLLREKMPYDFKEDRTITKAESYIFDDNCESIKIKLKDGYIKIKNKEERIVFM
ncbi:type I-B CRISPR-associated protein Cas5b [Clostridium sp. DL1XJH146]